MCITPLLYAQKILDNPTDAADIEAAHEVHVTIIPGLGSIYGFTYVCAAGHRHVVINKDLCERELVATYWHEAHHCFSQGQGGCRVAEELAEGFALRLTGGG